MIQSNALKGINSSFSDTGSFRNKRERLVERNFFQVQPSLNLIDLEFEKWTKQIEVHKLAQNQSQTKPQNHTLNGYRDPSQLPIYTPVYKKQDKKGKLYNITSRWN